ncbi:MAG: UbiD family decarboxylase, partial [Gemmatimonadota bacterium]|nr:UbiD family decarboxylase [Gemmatimonadota bacterium]
MTIDSVRSFVTALETAGELRRVRHPVSVVREITEIADRCMKSPRGGPALLFEQPRLEDGSTSAMPVAINVFGSLRRMGLALGVEQLDDIGDRIAELLELKVPQ